MIAFMAHSFGCQDRREDAKVMGGLTIMKARRVRHTTLLRRMIYSLRHSFERRLLVVDVALSHRHPNRGGLGQSLYAGLGILYGIVGLFITRWDIRAFGQSLSIG